MRKACRFDIMGTKTVTSASSLELLRPRIGGHEGRVG